MADTQVTEEVTLAAPGQVEAQPLNDSRQLPSGWEKALGACIHAIMAHPASRNRPTIAPPASEAKPERSLTWMWNNRWVRVGAVGASTVAAAAACSGGAPAGADQVQTPGPNIYASKDICTVAWDPSRWDRLPINPHPMGVVSESYKRGDVAPLPAGSGMATIRFEAPAPNVPTGTVSPGLVINQKGPDGEDVGYVVPLGPEAEVVGGEYAVNLPLPPSGRTEALGILLWKPDDQSPAVPRFAYRTTATVVTADSNGVAATCIITPDEVDRSEAVLGDGYFRLHARLNQTVQEGPLD